MLAWVLRIQILSLTLGCCFRTNIHWHSQHSSFVHPPNNSPLFTIKSLPYFNCPFLGIIYLAFEIWRSYKINKNYNFIPAMMWCFSLNWTVLLTNSSQSQIQGSFSLRNSTAGQIQSWYLSTQILKLLTPILTLEDLLVSYYGYNIRLENQEKYIIICQISLRIYTFIDFLKK